MPKHPFLLFFQSLRVVVSFVTVNSWKSSARLPLLPSRFSFVTAGPKGANYDGILRMLDVLLSNEINEAEKRKILQDDYDIQMTQTMEREVSVMCNLSKGIREKGRAEGMANGILASIKNLVKNMGVSVEQAMSVLEIPEAERQKYMDLLERQ